MQPHVWYYHIIGTIQAEDLVQVFSLHYNVRYWVNRLNIAINSVSKYGNMSKTTKCHNPKLTVSYSNPQYLGPSYFEQTGRPYSNLLGISWGTKCIAAAF